MGARSESAHQFAGGPAPGEVIVRPALGTVVALVVADAAGRRAAADVLDAEIAAIELACARLAVASPLDRDLDAARPSAADRIAARVAEGAGCGAMVTVGSCVAMAGPAPRDGWLVGIADDPAWAPLGSSVTVALRSGGLVTSRAPRRPVPRLGEVADPARGVWRAVSVLASSCLLAAEVGRSAVLGDETEPAALAARGFPARLVAVGGAVAFSGGWDDLVPGRRPPPAARIGVRGRRDEPGRGRRPWHRAGAERG